MRKLVFLATLFVSLFVITDLSYAVPTPTPTPIAGYNYSTRNIQFGVVNVTSAGGTAVVTLPSLFTTTPVTYIVLLTFEGAGNPNAVFATETKINGQFTLTVRDKNGVVVNCSVTNQKVHWSAYRMS